MIGFNGFYNVIFNFKENFIPRNSIFFKINFFMVGGF